MENKQLVESAQCRNEASFNQLIESCMDKVRCSVFKQYKFHPHDLADVMSKATIKAWNNIEKFRGDAEFATWFHRIARNEAYDFMKAKMERENIEMPSSDDPTHNSYLSLENFAGDTQLEETAFTILERKEQVLLYQKMIEHALSQLNPAHKAVLQLSLDEEKSYKEISELLGIPVGTVMSRLHAARQSAQKLIREYSETKRVDMPFKI